MLHFNLSLLEVRTSYNFKQNHSQLTQNNSNLYVTQLSNNRFIFYSGLFLYSVFTTISLHTFCQKSQTVIRKSFIEAKKRKQKQYSLRTLTYEYDTYTSHDRFEGYLAESQLNVLALQTTLLLRTSFHSTIFKLMESTIKLAVLAHSASSSTKQLKLKYRLSTIHIGNRFQYFHILYKKNTNEQIC